MELPQTYEGALESVRAIFMSSVQRVEAELDDYQDTDDLEDAMWQDLMSASHRFTGGHQFDLDWCVTMLKSKPGLSRESLETQSDGSVEQFIHEVIRVKIYDQLESELTDWISEKARALKPSAPTP